VAETTTSPEQCEERALTGAQSVDAPRPPRAGRSSPIPSSSPGQSATAIAAASLWIGGAALTAYKGYALEHDWPFVLGYVLGACAVWALMSVILARTALKQRRPRAWLIGGFALILFTAPGMYSAVRARLEIRGVVSDIRQLSAGGRLPLPADTTGVRFFLATTTRGYEQAWARYTAAGDSAGRDWLAPRRLASYRGRAAARRSMTRLMRALHAVETSIDSIQRATRGRLEKLEAERPELRGMLVGYDKSSPTVQKRLAAYFALERRALAACDSIVALADAGGPELTPDGRRLYFGRRADVQRYNALVARINALANEESRQQRALQADQLDRVLALDSLTNSNGL
jgi:hypothetical protein